MHAVGDELDSLSLKASRVGNWWFCTLQGSGSLEVQTEAITRLQSNHRFLTLAYEGRFDCPEKPSYLTQANTLALTQTKELFSFGVWGRRFSFLTVFLPYKELAFAAPQDEIPSDVIIPASFGRGAILAAAVRSLASEAFGMADTRSLKPMLPSVASMIIESFSGNQAINILKNGDIIESIIHYIEDNYWDDELSPKFISYSFGLSERQLYRLFSDRGDSFGALLRRVRLRQAAALLTSKPSLTIVNVAYECGFSSHSYFCQAFKLAYGISPTEYRNGLGNVSLFPARN